MIARVPCDEGSLTGTLTAQTRWLAGDWRTNSFVPENLHASLERADTLTPQVPAGSTLSALALRFILSNPTISTVIPGMRKLGNVRANIAASDGAGLPADLLQQLRVHRWDREPTAWSQ